MDGRGGTSQVEDLVDFQQHGFDDVMAEELETAVAEQVFHVLATACEEVVEADDLVAALEKAFAEMRTEKSGAAGDEDAMHVKVPGGKEWKEFECGRTTPAPRA